METDQPAKHHALGRTLFVLYVILFLVCAHEPFERKVWVAENIPTVLVVALIWRFTQHHAFSKPAWLFMAVFPALHTIGGHYTFAEVPFGFVTDLFGFERNHFDRMAHFTVGFFAFPIAEFLFAKRLVTRRVVGYLFALFTIMAIAAGYEVFEWWFALMSDPEAGLAVLGSQGDIWDAQKDILADTLGALFTLACFGFWRGRQTQAQPE